MVGCGLGRSPCHWQGVRGFLAGGEDWSGCRREIARFFLRRRAGEIGALMFDFERIRGILGEFTKTFKKKRNYLGV